jgi:hypothetical protein
LPRGAGTTLRVEIPCAAARIAGRASRVANRRRFHIAIFRVASGAAIPADSPAYTILRCIIEPISFY